MTLRSQFFHLSLASFLLTGSSCFGALTIIIFDDGTDLFIQSSGTYDLSNAIEKAGPSLGFSAGVVPQFGIVGWDPSPQTLYEISSSGPLTGSGSANTPSSVTALMPFSIDGTGLELGFGSSAPSMGTAENMAVFDGVTLASLGMVIGESMTGEWGSGGANERFSVNVIPEPSSMFLIALGGLGLLRRQRS